jgi:hypothetical protein
LKRIVYLAAAALVALLILAPAAMAQGTQPKMVETVEQKIEKTQPLPSSGGPAVGSVLLPAAALLVGTGVVAYAVMRRRR